MKLLLLIAALVFAWGFTGWLDHVETEYQQYNGQ